MVSGPQKYFACQSTHDPLWRFIAELHACEILRSEGPFGREYYCSRIMFTAAFGITSHGEAADGFGVIPIVDADRMGIVLKLLDLGIEHSVFDFIGKPQLCELQSSEQELG